MKQDNNSYERYQRQVILNGFGMTGQEKLLAAKILVIGAGGLGCPALQYLAGAGVGTIGIADDDIVAVTNLHRQPLYSTLDVGYSKAERAKHALARLNPEIHLLAIAERIEPGNALGIIEQFDIVIDGTDNFSSRYLVNDASSLLNKPLVYGAISEYEGQVAILNCRSNSAETPVNYRDLFPNPPGPGEVLNCAENGVLGVLPGIIGTMQAAEAIKLITGIGRPLVNTLLTYNVLTNSLYEIRLEATSEGRSRIPASAAEFRRMDYEWFCGSGDSRFEIDVAEFSRLIQNGFVDIINVREPGEEPTPEGFEFMSIPLSALEKNLHLLKNKTIISFCQSGQRSLQAARLLFDRFGDSKKIYSLKGGILKWPTIHSTANA